MRSSSVSVHAHSFVRISFASATVGQRGRSRCRGRSGHRIRCRCRRGSGVGEQRVARGGRVERPLERMVGPWRPFFRLKSGNCVDRTASYCAICASSILKGSGQTRSAGESAREGEEGWQVDVFQMTLGASRSRLVRAQNSTM